MPERLVREGTRDGVHWHALRRRIASTPGEAIEVWLHSTPVKLWSGRVSADGTFSRTVTIPESTNPGSPHVEVRATSGSDSLSLTVVEGLAVTGIDVDSVISVTALAVALAATGAGLRMWRRRTSRI